MRFQDSTLANSTCFSQSKHSGLKDGQVMMGCLTLNQKFRLALGHSSNCLSPFTLKE